MLKHYKDGFNPDEAVMGSLHYEEKAAKIRISEFRRVFGERSRKIYPTPYLKANPPKFPNVKRQKNYKWINTPCMDLSIFKDNMKQILTHKQIMEIVEKLNRDGMNDKVSDYLYEYFSSSRPHEKADYVNQFNVLIRQKREIRNENYSSPKRVRFTRMKRREEKRRGENPGASTLSIAPFTTNVNTRQNT